MLSGSSPVGRLAIYRPVGRPLAEIAKIVDFEGESANLYSESRQERVDLATLGLPSSITAQSGIVSGGETSGVESYANLC